MGNDLTDDDVREAYAEEMASGGVSAALMEDHLRVRRMLADLSERVGVGVSMVGAIPEVVAFIEKARQRETLRWKVLEAAETLAAMLFVDGIVRDRTMATMSPDVQECVWRVAETSFELIALSPKAE